MHTYLVLDLKEGEYLKDGTGRSAKLFQSKRSARDYLRDYLQRYARDHPEHPRRQEVEFEVQRTPKGFKW